MLHEFRIASLATATEHPLILPLSNPTSRMEAMPADALAWSHSKALVATGSPVRLAQYHGPKRWPAKLTRPHRGPLCCRV